MKLNRSLQKTLNIALGLSTFLFIEGIALAQTGVMIRNVRVQGSGCNGASARATISDDSQTLSILFDNYSAEIGQGSKNPNAVSVQQDCQVLIDVEVAPGIQYALAQTDYRGFMALPASAYGYHRFSQMIPGQPIVSMREAQLRGPKEDNYQVSVLQKPSRMIYSNCNQRSQTINMLSQLFVSYFPNSRDRSIAQINLDSIDSALGRVDPAKVSSFQLSWRRCQ